MELALLHRGTDRQILTPSAPERAHEPNIEHGVHHNIVGTRQPSPTSARPVTRIMRAPSRLRPSVNQPERSGPTLGVRRRIEARLAQLPLRKLMVLQSFVE